MAARSSQVTDGSLLERELSVLCSALQLLKNEVAGHDLYVDGLEAVGICCRTHLLATAGIW